MNWSASAVTTATSDTEPTIVVSFENAKYIFNVGENTTRAFLQTRKGFRRTKAVFLGRICSDRTAGLPGMLMSAADSGIDNLMVIGPEGTDHLLASMRLYTRREAMKVATVEIPSFRKQCHPDTGNAPVETLKPVLKDEQLTVFAVPSEAADTVPDISGPLKRKRSLEESWDDQDVKRDRKVVAAVESKESNFAYSSQGPAIDCTSLIERLSSPRFSPSCLADQAAADWRRLTISYMFGPLSNAFEDVDNGPGSEPQRLKKYLTPANCDKRLPMSRPNRTACSYIVLGRRPRGKFDVAKASALGLRAGPLRGKVARGETVEFEVTDADGRKEIRRVGPEDCLGESDKASVLCIIECPTKAYIQSLVDSPTWGSFQALTGNEPYLVHALVHVVGDDVLMDVRYIDWMKQFGDHVHHLVANKHYCADVVTFTDSAGVQLRLHNLDPEMFPLPSFSTKPTMALSDALQCMREINNISALQSYHNVEMRPTKPPTTEHAQKRADKFHPLLPIRSQDSITDETSNTVTEVKRIVSQRKVLTPDVPSDILVIPLGTGSASPSKFRNASSVLVQIPGHGNLLLDCGEGTWGQMCRHFGAGSLDVLRNLKCLFISHIHADHHTGLSRLLAIRRKLDPPPTEPLYVVAPRTIHLYIREYSDLEDLGLDGLGGNRVVSILSDSISWNRSRYATSGRAGLYGASSDDPDGLSLHESERSTQALCESLGLSSLYTVAVAHRTKCFGVVLKHGNGWSLVYSADTMPCNNLVEAGKGATLLIHEATMADDQADLAQAKAHSTCGQAIDIGRRMNAQNVLLTHFSARYPKVTPNALDGQGQNIALAVDHARIPLHSLWKLNAYQPAIELCYTPSKDDNDSELH